MKRSRVVLIISIVAVLGLSSLVVLRTKPAMNLLKAWVLKLNMREPLLALGHGIVDSVKMIQIRLTTPEENLDTTQLPVYSLSISPKKLDILNFNLPQSGRNQVSGIFDYEGQDYKIKLHYRGDMPWHWGNVQKSMKIKFKPDHLFQGQAVINLNNPEREVIDEILEYWLAKEMGLLTPECKIVHVRLNGQYLGVFLEIENVDEYFLKNHGQEIGNVYFGEQGDAPYETYVNIWKSSDHWIKKVSAKGKEINDISDLQRFIRMINIPDENVFREQITKRIDLPGVLSYIAFCDLGSSEHIGNINNNKLYFVPSTGILKMIPWDTAGHWTDEGAELLYERKKNDFWLRLLDVPEIRHEKNKILWKALQGVASTESQLNFIDRTYAQIRNDVYSDRYKDSYFQRPMTNAEFDKRVERLKDWTRKRNGLLEWILRSARVYVFDRERPSSGRPVIKKIEFVTKNESGILLKQIKIPIKTSLPFGSVWELWYDKNADGILDEGDALVSQSRGALDFNLALSLLNGIEIVEPPGYTRAMYEWIDQVPRVLPSRFNFFVTSSQNNSQDITGIEFEPLRANNISAENSITGDGAEIIVSPWPGYRVIQEFDPRKLLNNKGAVIDVRSSGKN